MKKRISLLIASLLIAILYVLMPTFRGAFAKSNQSNAIITPGGCNTTSDYYLRVGACISRAHYPSNPDFFTPDAYVSYYNHVSNVSSCEIYIRLDYSFGGSNYGGGGVVGSNQTSCTSDAMKGIQNAHYSFGILGNEDACNGSGCTFYGYVEVDVTYTNGTDTLYEFSPSMTP